MTENCMTAGMTDISVKDLIETLTDQQELLQQLYSELDMEREATATATNESLSMILRLQGERAAVEMEAKQYKRIAEQKMFHAEETVEVFRDVIYQKEMQIASLEFQVQAYRFKLLSLGYNDVGVNESIYPDNKLSNTNGVRRVCSLPPYLFKDGEEPLTDGEECESSVKVLLEMNDEEIGPAKSGDFSSYWEKIRRLDERVKRLSNSSDVSDTGNKLNEEVCKDHVTAVKVQDIFEVPQPPNDQIAKLPPAKLPPAKSSIEDGFYPVTPDAIKAVISDDIDKKNWDRRITMSPDIDNSFPKPRDGLTIEHMYLKRPDVTDLELQQMNKRLKRLEDERIIVRQEITLEKENEKLLLAIKNQLNSIEHEIKRWSLKKAPPKKEVDLSALTEALLHFW